MGMLYGIPAQADSALRRGCSAVPSRATRDRRDALRACEEPGHPLQTYPLDRGLTGTFATISCSPFPDLLTPGVPLPHGKSSGVIFTLAIEPAVLKRDGDSLKISADACRESTRPCEFG